MALLTIIFYLVLQFEINDLLKGTKLKPILKKLKSDGIVYDNDRRIMIRTLVKYLYNDHVR